MKNLKGMKNNFSSAENKKLQRKDLKAIQGGYKYVMTESSTCADKETYDDNGNRLNTLYVGDC